MAAIIRRCWMRLSTAPTGCAVSRWQRPISRRQELRKWNRIGVRGLRFNHFFRDGQLHYRGGVPLAAAQALAPVMAELGWHLQLWIDVKDSPETIPVLKSLGLPVVVDHMGRSDARAGTGTQGFQSLLARGRRRLVLGQAVGRSPHQPERTGLFRRAAVS